MEEGKVLDLDGKMWPDASDTDASSHYKVPLISTVQEQSLVAVLQFKMLCEMFFKETKILTHKCITFFHSAGSFLKNCLH